MLGDTSTSPMPLNVPMISAAMTPAVLIFFQYSVSTTAGSTPAADTANASATRWATFCFSAAKAITMPMRPTTNDVIRAARIWSFCSACPSLMTLV